MPRAVVHAAVQAGELELVELALRDGDLGAQRRDLPLESDPLVGRELVHEPGPARAVRCSSLGRR